MARILLAESDERISEFLSRIFADFGHEVIRCQNGSEATARLAIGPIDVLVSDLVLRDGDGAKLNGYCAAHGIPAITLTGREIYADQASRERPMPLLDKPFRFADLERVVEAVVARSGRGQIPVRATRHSP
jgi:DNA-binding NtrC family response regulator